MVLVFNDENAREIKYLLQKHKKKKFTEHLNLGEVSQNIKQYFSKIEKDHELHALKILSDINPVQKYSEYFNQIDILLLCKLVKPHEFSDIVTLMMKNKGYESILSYEEADVVDWFQKSDNEHPIMLVMGEDPLHRITDYLGRKRYKNVVLIPMG